MSKKQWVNGLDDLSETDKAYLAGLIDGEGCLIMDGASDRMIRPKLQLIMTDQTLVEWVGHVWGTPVRRFAKHRAQPHHKDQFRTTLTGMRAVDAIRVIYPYMRLKQRQADIFVEWSKTSARLKVDREWVQALRLDLKRQMHVLNDDRRFHPKTSERNK